MKALLEARQIPYSYNHSMADLLGTLRHFHPEMRDFRLSIPPTSTRLTPGDSATERDGNHA